MPNFFAVKCLLYLLSGQRVVTAQINCYTVIETHTRKETLLLEFVMVHGYPGRVLHLFDGENHSYINLPPVRIVVVCSTMPRNLITVIYACKT